MSPQGRYQVHVTDHAVVRYLERHCGVDIGAVRQEIVAGQVREQIEQWGSGEFPIPGSNEGLRARAVKGTVVTVLYPTCVYSERKRKHLRKLKRERRQQREAPDTQGTGSPPD